MASTRDKFVATASQLMQQKGFGATSVGEIAEVGGLPIGSLYYYFPGGKEELGAAAVMHGADQFAEVLTDALWSVDEPGKALSACALLLADRLEASNWGDGCPVATVALESVNRSQILQQAANDSLQSWVDLVAARMTELGIDAVTAAEVGSVTISTLEGAELMARVAGSRDALEAAAKRLPQMVQEVGS